MKIKILQKAWKVNAEKFNEPWYHGDITYYGTRGEARRQAIPDNDAGALRSGEYISFITIPIIRDRENDLILFDDEKMKRYQIEGKIRDSRIKQLPKDKFYYVQDKRSYVGNAVLWWALDGNGYVTDLAKAHKYTYDEIVKFNPRPTDVIWESTHVEKAIKSYVDAQYLDGKNSI